MFLTKSLIAAGKTIPFHLIEKGRGGLVAFHNDAGTLWPGTKPTATRPLGIYGARNSTGVYYACEQHYCFAAHIQCFVYDSKTSTVRQKVSKLEGQTLEKQILRGFRSCHGILHIEDTEYQQSAKRSYAASTLLMVNPDICHPDGSEQVGVYVAKAVRTYLSFKEEDHPVDTRHSGFVLQHLQDPFLIPLEAGHKSGDGKAAELQLFSEVEDFGKHNDDWTIVVNAREDWVDKD